MPFKVANSNKRLSTNIRKLAFGGGSRGGDHGHPAGHAHEYQRRSHWSHPSTVPTVYDHKHLHLDETTLTDTYQAFTSGSSGWQVGGGGHGHQRPMAGGGMVGGTVKEQNDFYWTDLLPDPNGKVNSTIAELTHKMKPRQKKSKPVRQLIGGGLAGGEKSSKAKKIKMQNGGAFDEYSPWSRFVPQYSKLRNGNSGGMMFSMSVPGTGYQYPLPVQPRWGVFNPQYSKPRPPGNGSWMPPPGNGSWMPPPVEPPYRQQGGLMKTVNKKQNSSKPPVQKQRPVRTMVGGGLAGGNKPVSKSKPKPVQQRRQGGPVSRPAQRRAPAPAPLRSIRRGSLIR